MTHAGQAGITIDSNGFCLLGTLFLAPGDDPKPTSVLLHGIPGIEKNYDLAIALRENGRNALIFHYRGSWGSTGAYNVPSIPKDVNDAVSALASGRYPQVDPGRISLIGHSLGGWAALLAGAADLRVTGVAAISAITDPDTFPLDNPDYAAEYTPWLTDVTAENLANQWAAAKRTLNPLEHTGDIPPRPLLVIHSAADQVIPVDNARRLAAKLGKRCQYIEHPDANHSFTWHRGWLQEQVLLWLNENHL